MGTMTVFECVQCQQQTAKIIKRMCSSCYRKQWLQTEGGQRLRQRVLEERKSPLTTVRNPRFDGDDGEPTAAAWLSPQSKIPYETQELIFRAYLEGHEPSAIAAEVDLETKLVKSLIDRGAISPRRTKRYRCPTCRHNVIVVPCFICWTKRHSSQVRMK